MSEDDASEAIDYFENHDKPNNVQATSDNRRNESKIQNSVLEVTKQQRRENPSFLTHNTQVLKEKYADDILESNKPVTSEVKSEDEFEYDAESPSVSTDTDSTPPKQKSDNKGFFRDSVAAIMKGIRYLATYCSMKDLAISHIDSIALGIAKAIVFLMGLEKMGKASCNKKDMGNKTFSSNKNTKFAILHGPVLDFYVNNVYQNFSNLKSNAKERTKFQQNPIHYDIKTLGDALSYFHLTSKLDQLEMSLENVRRNKKQKEDHADTFKQIDKEIQKLSFEYHPDRVRNRGGTEKEIETAQKEQTAINATRTVLKLLNSAFIENIDIDHKFGFYTKLSISSLCNEDKIKNHVFEVILKIGMISQIKQQNVISEIRKFLIESKKCVDSYLEKIEDFEKYRDSVLFHLKYCIKGFEKLCVEFEEVKDQCKRETNSKNMCDLLQNMESDRKRDLNLLKLLDKAAKSSLKGNYQFFNSEEVMDSYFVFPLVFYTNVILMCNVMWRSESQLNNIFPKLDPNFDDGLGHLKCAYFLASCCSDNKYHGNAALEIKNKKKEDFSSIKLKFSENIKEVIEFMENKFKVQDYSEAMSVDLLILDLKKCMTMMAEFEEKQQALSKAIKEFERKTERIDEDHEKLRKMINITKDRNKEVEEMLEKSRELLGKFPMPSPI